MFAFVFQVVSLTCHPWQQLLCKGNVRTRPDSNAILLEATSQKGSGDDQVCLGMNWQTVFFLVSGTISSLL
jgi:hypothetical protein